MDPTVKSLLLLGHLVMISAAPVISSYDEEISQVINSYNTFLAEENLFTLFKVEDQINPNQPGESVGHTSLTFLIKETVCPKSIPAPLENCDLKPDGVVVQCKANIIKEGNGNKISGHCMRISSTRNNKQRRLFDRAVGAEKKSDNDLFPEPERYHKEECLPCILSLLPRYR